jgi:hypothetical protein
MHEVGALYPGSMSTLPIGFGESARTPTNNSLQALKFEGKINTS